MELAIYALLYTIWIRVRIFVANIQLVRGKENHETFGMPCKSGFPTETIPLSQIATVRLQIE